MRVGVTFPQTEIGGDPGAVRAYAERVEELGFAHILAYDHVVGADPAVHSGWSGPYDVHTTFHEPFVLFGYLAAVTVARAGHRGHHPAAAPDGAGGQAGGRGRPAQPAAGSASASASAGTPSSTRRSARTSPTGAGASEEQIELLRRLWTEQSVTFDGEFETVTGAGIAPLPVQRPIPMWVGGVVAAGLPARRAAGRRLVPADGARGRSSTTPAPSSRPRAKDAGRDPATIGMEGRVNWGDGGGDAWSSTSTRWRDAGATHLSVNTMGAGLGTVDDHLAVLAQVADSLPLS